MNGSRDHHFVPVFYTKQWAGPDGKLIEYSKKRGKVIAKSVGPKATGFQRDLNSFLELPSQLAPFLEDEFLSFADNDAARALRLILAGDLDSLDLRLKSAWSRFLIGMTLRHPDVMKELREISLTMWRDGSPKSQEEYEKYRTASDPLTLEEYANAADPLIEPKVQIRLISKAMDNDIVGTRINDANWGVIDLSSAPHRLLTSDRPVEMFRFQQKRGIISIPISPTLLFVASHDQQLLREMGARSANEIA
jgi:hypothetical protein